MAVEGHFYGFGVELENTQSLFRGVSIEFSENLIFRFFDSFGNLIDDLDEFEINDGSTVTTINNVQGGSYSLNVESSTIFIVKATDDNKEGFASFIHNGRPEYLVVDIFLLTPPCVSEISSNKFGFLYFNKVNNVQVTELQQQYNPCGLTYDEYLPNAYVRNNEVYKPIVVEEEEISFQINFNDDGLDSVANISLAIIQADEIKIDGITFQTVANVWKAFSYTLSASPMATPFL